MSPLILERQMTTAPISRTQGQPMTRNCHARAAASNAIGVVTAALLAGCVVNGASPDRPQTPRATTGMTFDQAHDEALELLTDIQSATGFTAWQLFTDARRSCDVDDSKPALAADIGLGDNVTDADAEAAADEVVTLMEQRGFRVRKVELKATETDPGWEVSAGNEDGIQIILTLS